MGEMIACIPSTALISAGRFQGFCADTAKYADLVENPANISFQDRDKVETNPAWKQLIPYNIFYDAYNRLFLTYQRGKQQGEGRLHGKRSLGIGGHVNPCDSGKNLLQDCMARELQEEVQIIDTVYGVSTNTVFKLVGLLNDDSNPVGQVHLGLVYLHEASSLDIAPNEDGMQDFRWLTIEELLDDCEQYETWSQLCIQYLAHTQAAEEYYKLESGFVAADGKISYDM